MLIDDLQYLQPAVQQLLLERRGEFRAMLVTYTPWPRRASSPLLAALMGCSRALLLSPASLADADMCTVPRYHWIDSRRVSMPAGRLGGGGWRFRVRGAGSPGSDHGSAGCNSCAEGAGRGLKSHLGFYAPGI